MPYLSALEMCLRRVAIQIHIYLTLPYLCPRLLITVVVVWSSRKHLTQSERYLPPVDDLVSDEKVQAKFYAEKKRDRVRKTKIKQDKIIYDMRCEFLFHGFVGLSVRSV